ncbi:MAG TPA: acireductone synthase [Pyrinomonadaceae bacterium]|nr:acireductone synthase [Pyrinomonadaceae bacterium]
MTTPGSTNTVRAILLDIEGTTTPIAFVHEVLFSFARTHVRDYLAKHFDSEDVVAEVRLLREEHKQDVSAGKQPPPLSETSSRDDIESIAVYVNWLIDQDRKSTGLKSLQGKIWQEGYSNGMLRAQVFPDVAPALARWRVAGLHVSIFSSGSVLAQQLLFAHTESGDLRSFINNYFDTSVGKKGESASYRRIAEALRLPASEVLFVSDVVAELAAAREAGMDVVLSVRPGNQPQPSADQYAVIQCFDEL